MSGTRLAVESMRQHKLRTFLTLLGVVIGVASVVVVGAAIEGLGVSAETTVSRAFGAESYLVAQIASPGRMTRREVFDKLKRNKQIRIDDLSYLRLETGDRILYSPYMQRTVDAKYGDRTFEAAALIGVSSTLADIRDVAVAEGRFFTDQEDRAKLPVCVIGDDLRTDFFGGTTAIGKQIKVRGFDLTVIGIQERLGSSFGRTQDNSIYLPDTVFAKMFGYPRTLTLFARPRPDSGLTMDEALDVTRSALRARYKAKPALGDPFDFMTPDSIRSFVDNILGLISVVVVPVTMISLIVGAIVIMNIMLVSVTERTREIGVRKSIGARRIDIMLQFLLESVIVSIAGGLMGLALAAAICELLTRLLNADLKITPAYVFLAIFVSSTVGVLSGWYPASRAANLDPIEALRTE